MINALQLKLCNLAFGLGKKRIHVETITSRTSTKN